MSAFHAKGLSDLLQNPTLRDDVRNRVDELLHESRDKFATADEWEREQILDGIERQVKSEFNLRHCL